jgi:hypothetical protein
MSRIMITFVVFTGAVCLFSLSSPAAELTHEVMADARGDGPDGKGNTADDTWQF